MGTETGDDAAVWRLDDNRALVSTADFITPIVDDARVWGRIAAVNSVSDVYAMGGRPLFALNLVCWNAGELSHDLLDEVLAGAAEVADECGFVIAGGHTVDDPQPKFGLSVVGEVHPDRVLRNSGLRANDVLVLTKPIGTGVISTAAKAGEASDEAVAAMVASMSRTNADASTVALDAGANGCTDVTGFGLLGHLGQMARASEVDVDLDAAAVPVLPGARDLAAEGHLPGGSARNLEWIRDRLDPGSTDELTVSLLADAQTSGGLLFGVAPEAVPEVLDRLGSTGHTCAVVGRATPGTGRLRLRP
ncbi:selenide,water dikinase [Actinopolymorpha rutila]|uniref:Selenide,water dikinase n=1 Tax=Actinopolymorpha rutila TaxID=446787 RepID=A0A852Z8A2_9ACTN|nr:selenide,water dikinase [Actinopolymorpha rutila]